ncbi:zinc-binding metallopeptidase family protein [Brumimicrobium salinarum]|uniref:hypothetical protein n=1 Tax=Brumimicrobium salinarum TaxID=2058658 RepID=UPI001F0C341F|nr:hypothetical protein [Brumimicrobium salinarum]
MKQRIYFFITLLTVLGLNLQAQTRYSDADSVMVKTIYNEALENGLAYTDLKSLCKDIGARLSGSVSAELAVKWGYQKLSAYGFDKVYLQEVMVPHWERGTKENGYFVREDGSIYKVNLLALGGSVSTKGIMQGELVMFKNREELLQAETSEIKDKIVFISQPMDQKMITTFKAYGACYPIRGFGAIDAAKKELKLLLYAH